MQNIDPLIQREFDRLGINILESEHLADLVIAKVRNDVLVNSLLLHFMVPSLLVLGSFFI